MGDKNGPHQGPCKFGGETGSDHRAVPGHAAKQRLAVHPVLLQSFGLRAGVDDQEETGTVRITIRDNGVGIPEKYHSRLFV